MERVDVTYFLISLWVEIYPNDVLATRYPVSSALLPNHERLLFFCTQLLRGLHGLTAMLDGIKLCQALFQRQRFIPHRRDDDLVVGYCQFNPLIGVHVGFSRSGNRQAHSWVIASLLDIQDHDFCVYSFRRMECLNLCINITGMECKYYRLI